MPHSGQCHLYRHTKAVAALQVSLDSRSYLTHEPVTCHKIRLTALCQTAANTAASASPVQAVVAPSHNVVNPSSADAEDVRDSAGRGDHGTLQQQHVQANATAAPVKTVDPDAFIPTRKVRQPPGEYGLFTFVRQSVYSAPGLD